MEQTYSVGTTNRYALFFDEEDDPGDVVLPSTTKPEKDSSSKSSKEKGGSKQQSKGTKGKENKERIAKEQQSKKAAIENAAKAAQDKNAGGGRGQKSGGRGGDRERDRQDNRRPQSGEVKDREDRPPRGQNAGGRRQRLPSKEKDRDGGGGSYGEGFSGDREGRGSRGRGGPRPFRGGRGGGGFRGGKREFERRSGSDRSSVKATEKREGGGAHNWGKAEDVELNEEWPSEEGEPGQEPKTPTTNGETTTQEEKGDTEVAEKEEEATPEEEEGPREMTLEEYKQKCAIATVKSELSVRKAGENVDDAQWKDTVQLQKDEEEFFPGTREVIEKVKTSGRVKTTLESHFFFRDPARRGRGRSGGGRGGFEGSRGGFEGGRDREGGRFEGGRDREGGRYEGGRDREGGRYEGGRDREGGRYEGGRDREGGRYEGGRDREGGRFEGGRGGGRGQGSGRRFNRRDRAPNVEDERDFPSLGGASTVEVM